MKNVVIAIALSLMTVSAYAQDNLLIGTYSNSHGASFTIKQVNSDLAYWQAGKNCPSLSVRYTYSASTGYVYFSSSDAPSFARGKVTKPDRSQITIIQPYTELNKKSCDDKVLQDPQFNLSAVHTTKAKTKPMSKSR